jgi:hypothetical protein
MRIVFLAICLACSSGIASAQDQPNTNTAQDRKAPDKSEFGTEGRTMRPETKGQMQPQGRTGPLETGSGGAPAESPQGDTPPAMQAAPEGSSKTTVSPDKR